MDQQTTHGLRPQLRPRGQNLCSHLGGERRGCAGITRGCEMSLLGPPEGGQERQIVQVITGAGRRIDRQIAALEHHIWLDRPWPAENRGSAARPKIAAGSQQPPATMSRIIDGRLFRVGPNSECVPGLRRALDRQQVITVQIPHRRHRFADIACADNDEAGVVVLTIGQFVKLGRPGCWPAPPIIGWGRCRQTDHPRPGRCGDLNAGNRFGGYGAIEVGIVIPAIGQDLHRFKAMCQRHSPGAGEDRHEIAIERDAGHLGAMPKPGAADVVNRWRTVPGLLIRRVKGWPDQQMAAGGPAIEQADRWSINGWWRQARQRVFRPLPLIV